MPKLVKSEMSVQSLSVASCQNNGYLHKKRKWPHCGKSLFLSFQASSSVSSPSYCFVPLQFVVVMPQARSNVADRKVAVNDISLDEEQKRWDGLLPNRRSAVERQQSFLQRQKSITKNSSSSNNSSSRKLDAYQSNSLAFSFCGSETSSISSSDDEEKDEDDIDAKKALYSKVFASSFHSTINIQSSFRKQASGILNETAIVSQPVGSISNERRVKFSTVTVHWHNTVLGDNPSVSSGVPLALGWTCMGEDTYCVEGTTLVALPRKTPDKLKLPAGVRERILRETGVKYVDILRRVEQCDALRYQQQESIRRAATAKQRAPTSGTYRGAATPKRGIRLFFRRLCGRA